MVDIVGTCPKDFWSEWIAEGDAAGLPESGEEWGWYTRHSYALLANPGDRFYVVAWGRLRGWAPIVRVNNNGSGGYCVCRKGGAVACTIARPIPGFRGLAKRWWNRDEEIAFPNWKTAGVGERARRALAKQESGAE
ncbi:MAG TPA: hypothetical protein VFX37_09860 [Pseudolabrys sp.]|nr:hypothetical protein [Pseudolabrys sp.]